MSQIPIYAVGCVAGLNWGRELEQARAAARDTRGPLPATADPDPSPRAMTRRENELHAQLDVAARLELAENLFVSRMATLTRQVFELIDHDGGSPRPSLQLSAVREGVLLVYLPAWRLAPGDSVLISQTPFNSPDQLAYLGELMELNNPEIRRTDAPLDMRVQLRAWGTVSTYMQLDPRLIYGLAWVPASWLSNHRSGAVGIAAALARWNSTRAGWSSSDAGQSRRGPTDALVEAIDALGMSAEEAGSAVFAAVEEEPTEGLAILPPQYGQMYNPWGDQWGSAGVPRPVEETPTPPPPTATQPDRNGDDYHFGAAGLEPDARDRRHSEPTRASRPPAEPENSQPNQE